MPFTISHVAAIIPFARPLARWRLLSATVIGSMVPDFGLLLPWRPPRTETHSALGLLTFCLPVGLVTFWLFQQLIKPAIIEILPDATYLRWRPLSAPADLRSLWQWAMAACGVGLGAVTHLVWDAFTHEGARGVRMIPLLDDSIVDIAGHHLIGARLLQDWSSLAGLCFVLAVVAYGLRPGRNVEAPSRRLDTQERFTWMVAYVLTAVVIAGSLLLLRHPHAGVGKSLALWVGNYAVAALRGFAAALVVVSLCLILRLRAGRPGAHPATSVESSKGPESTA
jgi:hypothetical protein